MVPQQVVQAVAASLSWGGFFAPRSRPLRFEFEPELTWRWEVLSGRLLDPALTREERTFAAWHVQQQSPGGEYELRISLLYD